MTEADTQIRCIACSIFKKELESLIADENIPISSTYLSSMLHMTPDKLDRQIEKEVDLTYPNQRTVLLYGDCSPSMETIGDKPGISRLPGINCIEIFLGRERYRQLRKEGAFFLMPEWTLKWKHIFKNELGLSESVAKELMGEMHSKIIYIDTEQIEVPARLFPLIEAYTGLKIEVLKVDGIELRKAITAAIKDAGKPESKLLENMDNPHAETK